MLKADRLPPAARQSWRPERKAWAVLLSAFAIFCLLSSATVYGGYRWMTGPRPRTVTAQIVEPSTALLKRSGLVRSEVLVDNSRLSMGDRVIIPEGPPGIAARLNTGGATVALWPLTSMLIEESAGGQVRLRLERGQAQIELPGSGPSLVVATPQLAEEVELTAPGRYRIRWLDETSLTTARAERPLIPGFEVATASGHARIGEISVDSGKRLVASRDTLPLKNRWPLLRDGDFRDFTSDEYMATLHPETSVRTADTWIVSRQALSEGANAQSGLFHLRRECNSTETKQEECRNVVRFARLGGNEKGSITAITQEIAADVSAYKAVVLEADVRIDFQSLSKGGSGGTECPLFARVIYANATGEAQKDYCFWAFDNGRSGDISELPWITSRQIPPKTWYHFRVDLRDEIPDLRAIQRVQFFSNGHDYDASAADISLSAEGLDVVQQ